MDIVKHSEGAISAELQQENKVLAAIVQPKINSAQDEEIKAVLKYCFALIGLNPEQWPDDLQKMVILNFIRENYSGHSLEEIKTAFELGVAGKLEIEMIHYQNFNCVYLTDVMIAYRKYSTQVVNTQPQLALPAPEPSKDEIDMQDKTFANEYYRKYLDKDFSSVSLSYAHMIYDVLDRFDLLQYSVKQKKEYYAKAQKARERELSAPSVDFQERKSNTKLMESYVEGVLPSSEVELIKQYAKRFALFDRFDIWKAEGKKIIID